MFVLVSLASLIGLFLALRNTSQVLATQRLMRRDCSGVAHSKMTHVVMLISWVALCVGIVALRVSP